MKLHGVPLSQPFRSIAWACLQQRLRFEIVVVVPGSKAKNGSRSEEYLKVNPMGTVPMLEEADGTVIMESPAILIHLAEKHGWHELWPRDSTLRARVNAYMHWHHTGLRLGTVLGGMGGGGGPANLRFAIKKDLKQSKLDYM